MRNIFLRIYLPMGVKGLQEYINSHGGGRVIDLDPLNFDNKSVLIIDGEALCKYLWFQTYGIDWIHGGQFLQYLHKKN